MTTSRCQHLPPCPPCSLSSPVLLLHLLLLRSRHFGGGGCSDRLCDGRIPVRLRLPQPPSPHGFFYGKLQLHQPPPRQGIFGAGSRYRTFLIIVIVIVISLIIACSLVIVISYFNIAISIIIVARSGTIELLYSPSCFWFWFSADRWGFLSVFVLIRDGCTRNCSSLSRVFGEHIIYVARHIQRQKVVRTKSLLG